MRRASASTDFHVDYRACRSENGDAASADSFERISLGTDDAGDAGGDRARRCRGAFCRGGNRVPNLRTAVAPWVREPADAEGFDFRVGAAESLVPTFADDCAIAYDHTADHRIGFDEALAARGEFQCPGHE